jgi:triose/dihydroxyacetone kinase / FAD-AMP lyase (cyclizing)
MIMGDGDCGTTLVTGSNALCQAVNAGSIDTHNLGQSIMAIADTVSLTMGGTSGALYAVFFAAFASSICNNFKNTETCGFSCIIDALKSALRSLMNVTMARKGDRTMMDALIPFVDTMVARQSAGVVTALNDAVMAAKDGCDATKHMESMFGRSTYVAVEDTKDSTEGLADPGACGIVTIVEGVRNALRGYV